MTLLLFYSVVCDIQNTILLLGHGFTFMAIGSTTDCVSL